MAENEVREFAVKKSLKQIKELHDFCDVELDRLEKEVKEITSRADQLEHRKRLVRAFMRNLDVLRDVLKEAQSTPKSDVEEEQTKERSSREKKEFECSECAKEKNCPQKDTIQDLGLKASEVCKGFEPEKEG